MGLRPTKGNTVVLPANKVAFTFRVSVAVSLRFSLLLMREGETEKILKKNNKTFLEPTRLFLSAAVPGHPGGSTLAGYLWSATIHHLEIAVYRSVLPTPSITFDTQPNLLASMM